MRRTKPTLSADYVVGLTDGEGCFYVNLTRMSAYRSGVRVQLHFHIKLQETDKGVLEEVCATLGCGNVYLQKERRINHVQCYRYTVSAQKDILEHVIPFFKTHPLHTESKRKNFELFCRIAEKVSAGEHLTEKGVRDIRALKKRMNQRTVGLA